MTRHWHVHPAAFLVAGRTRDRLVLIVAICPRCRKSHTHAAPPDFAAGMRTAACGARYVVLVDRSRMVRAA